MLTDSAKRDIIYTTGKGKRKQPAGADEKKFSEIQKKPVDKQKTI